MAHIVEPSMLDLPPEHGYVHVPFCASKCAYCGFQSTTQTPPADFPEGIAAELTGQGAEGWTPSTLYVGGGTPTALGSEGLGRLCAVLVPRRKGASVPAEWTVEANPGTLSGGLAKILRNAGVTRLSIGAQSFDEHALAVLGRRHGGDAVRTAVRAGREAGFPALGLDLIAGVPGRRKNAWRRTLDAATALEPEHLSVYALSIEPGTPLADAIATGRMPRPDDAEQMDALGLAEEVLTDRGYRRYEISNYAREGFECRHNLAIWRGADFLGAGPAAASRRGLRRWTNMPDFERWRAALRAGLRPPRDEETLSAEEDAAERFLTRFRLAEGAAPDPATPFGRRLQRGLRRLERLKVVETCAEDRWRLTSRGREVADAVLRELV